MTGLDQLPPLRRVIVDLPLQKIVGVATYAANFDDVIPLWYGESDVVTAEPIREAAVAALRAGRTFYPDKSGVPALRQALSRYSTRLYGREIAENRLTITASGMAALMIAVQVICGPGENSVLVTPLWPNAEAILRIMKSEVRQVALSPDASGRWHLDLDRLFAACDGKTRAIFINAPSNPTGWVCPREQQQAILDFARKRRIWVIADEVYNRIVYDRPLAPSFLEVAQPDDPLIQVNSFSKTWAMTGWRLGWLTAPPALEPVLANLVEYTTSGAAEFAQYGAIEAVEKGEAHVAAFVDHCRRGRDIVGERLTRLNNVAYAPPEAAFYAFFRVEGLTDSLEFARKLVREARVGVAPGIAFGPESEGWIRLCFAQGAERLSMAMDRLEGGLRGGF